ncbi:organomercurial lyase [Kitasatospora sp. NPDC058046]|uniref:organomercurial lyase n=1 Tax=Kitasatospora sp. NPDC058046 TaxID=3346312 RepID=UPI0036DEDBB8
MRVEMLTVPDCPNGPVLEERLQLVLAGLPAVELAHHVVEDQEEAERRGMHGSPTLLIDGRDPFAAPGTPASVSCRLYRGPDGRAGGAPSVDDLRRVLAGSNTSADPDRRTAHSGPAGRGGRGRLAPAERGLRAVQQAVLRSFATTGTPPETADLERAAEPFGVPAEQVLAELAAEDFLTLDQAGQIQAAYPFSATETEHAVHIAGGPQVWSMCAIDALGIPTMLGADAVITSTDPVTGHPIRVEFTGGATTWQPASAVVYYGARSGDGPAASVCCGYLRFFTDRTTAEQWTGQQAGLSGAILNQADAERLGAEIFGALLTDGAG